MTLTREEILAMEPSEDMDALIGKEIMNAIPDVQWWVTDGEESGIFITFDYESEAKEWLAERVERFPGWVKKEDAKIVRKEIFKHYSSRISAAWEVVEKLRIAVTPQSIGAPEELSYMAEYENAPYVELKRVFAKTAAEAICKCALLAVLNL